MSDTISLDYQYIQKVLTLYWDLSMMQISGRKPEEYKEHIGTLYSELKRLGAPKKTLKDMEQYAKKIGSEVVPYDEKKFVKMVWKVMNDITMSHIRKAKREGKKLEFK